MSPGGTLKARLPLTCSLKVYALDPHTHDWNEAKVDMHVVSTAEGVPLSEESAQKVTTAFNVSVTADHEPGRNFLQLEAPVEPARTALARGVHQLRSWLGGPLRGERPLFDSRVVFDVGVPGRFDLDVELAGGTLAVEGTLEGDVRVYAGSADIVLRRLKSMYVDVEADDGDVFVDAAHGNVSVRTTAGNIDFGRLQGPSVRLVTDSGDVQVRVLYADYAMTRTREGTVRLGGAQGHTKIRTVEGNVEIAGVEGRLDVETDAGDVEANLSVPETVSMRSRYGDIVVGLPEAVDANLLFQAGGNMEIDSRVGFHESDGKEEHSIIRGHVRTERTKKVDDSYVSIHARAPSGDVSVTRHSWGAKLYSLTRKGVETFPRWIQHR